MELNLHATHPTPHGTSRLVHAMFAWSVKTRVLHPGIFRDARVYAHTTKAIHAWDEYTPSTPPPPKKYKQNRTAKPCAGACSVSQLQDLNGLDEPEPWKQPRSPTLKVFREQFVVLRKHLLRKKTKTNRRCFDPRQQTRGTGAKEKGTGNKKQERVLKRQAPAEGGRIKRISRCAATALSLIHI